MEMLSNFLSGILEILEFILDTFISFFESIINFLVGLPSLISSFYSEISEMILISTNMFSHMSSKMWFYMFYSFMFGLILYFINKSRGD